MRGCSARWEDALVRMIEATLRNFDKRNRESGLGMEKRNEPKKEVKWAETKWVKVGGVVYVQVPFAVSGFVGVLSVE